MKQKINRIFLLFIGLSWGYVGLFAQTTLLHPAEIYLGTTFGSNISLVNFKPYVEQKPQLGYVGGLTFRYVNENHFGLQIEANYSQKGWKQKDDKYVRQVNYLEIPFLSHFYLGNQNRLIFNIGPKVSFLLNEKVLKNEIVNPTLEHQTNKVYYPFGYGVELGLGYNFKTRKVGVFQMELRGSYALSDIFSNDKKDYFDNSNYINFGLRIGWLFQLTGIKKD
ncbi:MAG: hypothetical protein CR965_00365 [Paludibacter sp.]|nr:MAG: hypothetical protein CR965_00365 [Paludibacter sp.]